MPKLSIVIPMYNEAERIGDTLRSFSAYLDAQAYEYELIVVDDGCVDDSISAAQAAFLDVRIVSYGSNRGKGYAVRKGLEAATGEVRFFADADGSTPIEEIEKFWPRFESGADIVIASRSLPESDVRVHQAWYRENMGKIFNFILKSLALTPFTDTQCGFKGYTAAACDAILPRLRIDGFAFDVEHLHVAGKMGLRIEEVPVTWINSKRTTVNPIIDSAKMILESINIRLNAVFGRYA